MRVNPSTGTSTWIPLATALAPDVSLSVRRSVGPPVHDSLVREFFAAILGIPGSAKHEAEVAGGARRHVVRVRFEGAGDVNWRGRGFEAAAPFYATRARQAGGSGLWTYTVHWSRPKERIPTDPAQRAWLSAALERWAKRHRWTPDDVGPFVSIDHFFDGNGNQNSIHLPLWPRLLVLSEAAEVLRAAGTIPGVEQVLVEIGSPLAAGSAEWPIAGDLAVVGAVDSDAVAAFWEEQGLLKGGSRIGPGLDVVVLDPDRDTASVISTSHSIWISPQLFPVWQRTLTV